MPTMREDEAAELIRPQEQRLNSIVRSAWAALDRYRDDLPIFTRRTRANIVRDHMVNNAIHEFDGVPGVTPTFRKGRFFLAFRDELLVQLKKLGKRRRPRNYPTRQAVDIENQQGDLFDPRQLTLFDLGQVPPPTVVTAGYKLDRLESQIEEVAVVCHVGQQLQWKFDIPDTPDGPPTPARIPLAPRSASRIVPRDPGTEERKGTDGESR
jgi:hypothetical protein